MTLDVERVGYSRRRGLTALAGGVGHFQSLSGRIVESRESNGVSSIE